MQAQLIGGHANRTVGGKHKITQLLPQDLKKLFSPNWNISEEL